MASMGERGWLGLTWPKEYGGSEGEGVCEHGRFLWGVGESEGLGWMHAHQPARDERRAPAWCGGE